MKTEVREQLNHLRNEDLLSLARNPAADRRDDAILLLVECGSPYAGHEDIAVVYKRDIEQATQLLTRSCQ
jgi:hypothetical protein